MKQGNPFRRVGFTGALLAAAAAGFRRALMPQEMMLPEIVPGKVQFKRNGGMASGAAAAKRAAKKSANKRKHPSRSRQ
jgi:hypothetical protein